MERILIGTALLALVGCSALAAASAPVDAFDHGEWQPVGLCGGGGLFNPVVSPHDSNLMMVESDMGGRYLSRDGGRTWKMLHFQQAGAACRGAPPLFHPRDENTIYALSGYAAATIRVSRDGGLTWVPLPDAQQPRAGLISAMRVTSSGQWYIGTSAGRVLSTMDEGETWLEAEGVDGDVINFVEARAAEAAVIVGTPRGVFVSVDGGRTFVRRTDGLPAGKAITGFAGGSNADDGTIVYVSTATSVESGALEGGVYVSSDLGRTWRRAMNPDIDVTTERSSPWAAPVPTYSHFVSNDATPSRAYVYCRGTSYFPPNHSAIYRTDDAGESWKSVWFVDPRFDEHNVGLDWQTSFMHQSWTSRPIDMSISPVDSDVVMRTDSMFLYITRNGGDSWWPGHAREAASADSDNERVWRNNGLVNTTTWNYYVDPHESNRHYIAYTDIGLARSLDWGATWRWWGPGERASEERDPFPIPRDWINTTYELAIDPVVSGRIWGVFSGHHDIPNENSIWRGTGRSGAKGGVAVSHDFGKTWTARMNGLPEVPALSVIIDPSSPEESRTLYAAMYDNGVYKSVDGGASWVRRSEGLGHPENMRVVRLLRHDDGTLFCLITGMRQAADAPFKTEGVGLYLSRDEAETWTLANEDYPILYPRDFAVDPTDSGILFIGASDTPGQPSQGGLHMSLDGGKSWREALRKRKTHFGAYFHPERKGWIYATCCGWSDAPEGSLFLSKDSGETWQPFPWLPFAQINRVCFDPGDPDVIYCTTFGGSVWKGPAIPGKAAEPEKLARGEAVETGSAEDAEDTVARTGGGVLTLLLIGVALAGVVAAFLLRRRRT